MGTFIDDSSLKSNSSGVGIGFLKIRELRTLDSDLKVTKMTYWCRDFRAGFWIEGEAKR